MIPDIKRLHILVKDIQDFRERLLNEIPEICQPDYDLADHVYNARIALNDVYRDLDQILLDLDC